MHLGTSSLTHLEQHCTKMTDTREFDSFGLRDPLTCCAMCHLLHNKQYLFDQRVITRVSRFQQLLATLHLHATHIIFVIRVDELIILINLFNHTDVLPPDPS